MRLVFLPLLTLACARPAPTERAWRCDPADDRWVATAQIGSAPGTYWRFQDGAGRFAFVGATCNDVRLGPAPSGRVATCVAFADHAEARFVPDPAGLR